LTDASRDERAKVGKVEKTEERDKSRRSIQTTNRIDEFPSA